ncbi:syntabulin isoform X4 [Gouania willdenowi]|uniref:syntabulin isoform X4 n=1 Tax=Gouania willdenowi TaxID=441366 RepID=UPI001056BE20|nr:syntabulin isoform X4 [Gouania willdenowi]
MGPFQEYEEKKTPEKGSHRSRIPRLILHHFRPKDKASPQSDSPFSEEEGKECDVSSDHSRKTISTNSFCSDDTGCPTSQSVSPSKTPSGSDQSAHSSPTLPERKSKVKRVRVMGEWNAEPRHKRELRSAMKPRGSEADFSSSSSSGSLKTKELLTPNSAGRKASTRKRTNPSRYHSCGDNHGIRPPNPEQYLTPMQQKEVAIRHLKTKLLESENRVQDREMEIEELKGQLGRMREDWIEEECHRVEAQLSLKEARKEIKQLRQVVETMKSSLMEKDKGIQKYFIDINIQNRKLESLLHSMELAQSGSNLPEESSLDFICNSPDGSGKKLVGEEEVGMELGYQGAEAMADSGLLVNDEMANRADILEQVFMSTAMDFSQDSVNQLKTTAGLGTETSAHGQLFDQSTAQPLTHPLDTLPITVTIPSQHCTQDRGVQTEHTLTSADVQALLLQLLKFHGATEKDKATSNIVEISNLPTTVSSSDIQPVMTPSQLGLPLESPNTSVDSGMCSGDTEGQRFIKEIDFSIAQEERRLSPGLTVVGKRYWSNSFLMDLVAVAAPVLPTVAWLYSNHGVDGSAPVYNIATLMRGCCIMGLRSLRHVAHGSNV